MHRGKLKRTPRTSNKSSGIDVRSDSSVVPKYTGPENTGIPADWSGNITKLWGIKEIVVQTESGPTITQVEYPLAEANSIEELERYCWPDPNWFDYADLRERLKEWTEFAILCSGCSVFQHPTYVRGMDKLMLDMAINPEMADFVFDTFTDFYYEFYRRIFKQAGDLIDIFALADDLGIKAGQLFNVLRVAVTARDATPPLFETMAVLGKERCLKRIRAAISRLSNK